MTTLAAIAVALLLAGLIEWLVPDDEASESRHRIEAEYDRLRRGDA